MLFIYLQAALAQSLHSGSQITKHKFSSLPLPQSPHPPSLDCRAAWSVFNARIPEIFAHKHIPNNAILKELYKLVQWKWKQNGNSKLKDKYFTYVVASALPARPPEKGTLSHVVWKHCLSANDPSWVCRKSRLAIHSPFFRDRGDTMIAQPSLALESPLLLLLPSVPVAQVRLHSGFQCWLYFASAANGIRSASSSRWKTLGMLTLSVIPLTPVACLCKQPK